MTWTDDRDSAVLSQSLNAYASTTPALAAGPVLQRGRQTRARRRAIGGGLLFGAVICGGIGMLELNAATDGAVAIQPAGPTAAATTPAVDRWVFEAEFSKNGSTNVTRIADRAQQSSAASMLFLIRNPESSSVPKDVMGSKDPVFTQERISGITVWLTYPVPDRRMRLAAWVNDGRQYTLRAERQVGGGAVKLSQDDLRAVIRLAISGH